MRIKQASLENVTQTADVYEVVSDFLTLRRAGRNYQARCPFHNEKSPSFNVNPDKGIYKCFGCGKAGDSVTFLMELENLSFVEAIEWLAKKYSITLEYEQSGRDEDKQAADEREALLLALKFAADFYRKQLTGSEEGKTIALPYLKERGLLPATQEQFQVGWAPDSFDGLLKAAELEKYSPELLEKAGLLIKKESGGYYDRFRARIMFPIQSETGKVLGFGGRTLVKDAKTAKYINSPETDVYNKSRILYGLWQSRQQVRKENQVYLTEGYMDVVAMHQAGIGRAVASSGTSLTEEQARLMTRYAENVTVLFDGDAAGLKAAMRGIDILLEEGLNVRVLLLPEDHDPDSYLKAYGADGFDNFAKANEADFVTFKTSVLAKEAGTDPYKKAALISEVVRTIALIADPIKRSVFFAQCAQMLGVDQDVLITEANRMAAKRVQERGKNEARDAKRGERDSGYGTRDTGNAAENIPPPVSGIPYPAPPDDFDFDNENLPDFGIGDLPPGVGTAPPEPGDDPFGEAQLGTLIGGVPHEERVRLQEIECLRLLLIMGAEPVFTSTLREYLLNQTADIGFLTPGVNRAIALMATIHDDGRDCTASDFMLSPDLELRRLVAEVLMQVNVPSENWLLKKNIPTPEFKELSFQVFKMIVRLKYRLVHLQIEELMHTLPDAKTDERQIEIVQTLYPLKNLEREIKDLLDMDTI